MFLLICYMLKIFRPIITPKVRQNRPFNYPQNNLRQGELKIQRGEKCTLPPIDNLSNEILAEEVFVLVEEDLVVRQICLSNPILQATQRGKHF